MKIPQQYKFIILLGKALHMYGVPSYKIQNYLTSIAEKKGIKGGFMDTPTWINYVFYLEDDHTYNYIESVLPGDLNLGALSKVSEITDKVLDGIIDEKQAAIEINDIKKCKKMLGNIGEACAFIFSAGAFSVILDTNWASAIAAAFLGIFVYALTYLASKSEYISSTLEALAAFVVTIGAGLLSIPFPEINISLTILASIIILIPGLAITTALEEITSKSLVSGTAKLADAIVSLFKQFFGVILGISLLPFLGDINPNSLKNDIPTWMDPIAIFALLLGLVVVMRVRKKDVFLALVTGFISYYITILMAFTGLLISIFVGTIIVVLLSKLWSKINNSPKMVFLTPGIIMLVPGSKAFIGLSTVFLKSGVEHSTSMGEQVLLILLGIIGGLIFSGSFMNNE
ncbi:MAG: threonine/serine exporter family protein [Bacteroidota bacterium]|nr:threonine/serine exporter family protein [Bacteroidota bacterium]